ncbi:hypothetical protein ACIRL2_41400 [Embleya sp. NPDC127516]|uniref:hypothetical protein n=1 Tax=Embleya sp. NPDC127516 TaxID=3363990 RepID=UPI0038244620
MPTDEPFPCCHADPAPAVPAPRSRWRRRAFTALGTLVLAVLVGVGQETGRHLVTDTASAVASITE